jgi:putative DNA primase/helicase
MTRNDAIARYAKRYAEMDMALTWTPAGAKGPRHPGWNLAENAITTPAAALRHWMQRPQHGVAALLSFSGLVSLDIDEASLSRQVLAALDIDLDALAARTPCIVGRPDTFRLMFRAPAVELKHRTAKWPKQDKPRESRVLFELRAGAIADSLPPTIHAKTGQPYRWAIPPRDGFTPLPDRLLELWQDWPATERTVLAGCPNWTPTHRPPARSSNSKPAGKSVIDQFNAAHDLGTVLESYGYKRTGKRFASPDTQHAPGLVLLDDGRVYCHHAGDPLGDGKPHDVFDVFAIFEHSGDTRAAVKAAAHILGLNQQERAA